MFHIPIYRQALSAWERMSDHERMIFVSVDTFIDLLDRKIVLLCRRERRPSTTKIYDNRLPPNDFIGEILLLGEHDIRYYLV